MRSKSTLASGLRPPPNQPPYVHSSAQSTSSDRQGRGGEDDLGGSRTSCMPTLIKTPHAMFGAAGSRGEEGKEGKGRDGEERPRRIEGERQRDHGTKSGSLHRKLVLAAHIPRLGQARPHFPCSSSRSSRLFERKDTHLPQDLSIPPLTYSETLLAMVDMSLYGNTTEGDEEPKKDGNGGHSE